jgi:hypothetical protein
VQVGVGGGVPVQRPFGQLLGGVLVEAARRHQEVRVFTMTRRT